MNRLYSLTNTLILFIVSIAAPCSWGSGNPVTQSVKEEILAVLISDTAVREYALIEIPDERNVTVYDDYIALHLFDGQRLLHNGIRSEVTVNYPFTEHETVVYEWEMMLPEGFQYDPDNRWWNMGQWHDQPDITRGETWEDLPGRSPPVSLHFEFYDERYYLAPRYMYEDPQPDEMIEVEPGVWIKLRFEIRWSQEDDGHLRIWVNNEETPHAEYTGPNMLNAYWQYLKVGMYRHPDISTDNTINIRSIKIYTEEQTRRSRLR